MNQLSVQILVFFSKELCCVWSIVPRWDFKGTQLIYLIETEDELSFMLWGEPKLIDAIGGKRVCFAKSRVIQKPFYLSSRSKNKMKSRVWFFGAIFHQFSSLDEIWGIKLEIKMHFFPLKGTENISSYVNCSFSHRRSILVLVTW